MQIQILQMLIMNHFGELKTIINLLVGHFKVEKILFMLEQTMECYMHLMQKQEQKNGVLYLHLLRQNYQ